MVAASVGNPAMRWVRYFAHGLLVVIWLLAFALIAWVYANPRNGSGMRLALTAAPLALATFLTLAWFLLFGPARLAIRVGVAVGVLATLVVAAGLFRLEEVDGGLRPRFVWRWSPTADRLLAPATVENPTDATGIDLTTTSSLDFPQFLGPSRNLGLDQLELVVNWDHAPPRLLWKQPIGAGWSAFVAVNGYAVTQEQRDDQELVTCYEIETGRLVWASGVTTRHETTMGGPGPRATPCIAQGLVYAQGATGILRCLDGATGAEQWRHDLCAEAGVADDSLGVAWGRAGSPLIVDGKVIAPFGGPEGGPYHSLIAFDARQGTEIWRAGNYQISYASPARVRLLDTEQILFVVEDRVCGFDPDTGAILWEFPWSGSSTGAANVSNAVAVEPDRVLLSKGYGQGSALIRIEKTPDNTWRASALWENGVVMKTKFSNVVVFDGFVYGLDDVILECLELETGKRRWKRGRYGYGQLLRVGPTLLVLGEQGQLAAVAARPDEYTELAQLQALEGKTWNNLCLYGNRLLIRNATEAACYELNVIQLPDAIAGDAPARSQLK